MVRSGGEAASSTAPSASANGHSGTPPCWFGDGQRLSMLGAVLVGHNDRTEVRQAVEDRADPLRPFRVDEDHFGP